MISASTGQPSFLRRWKLGLDMGIVRECLNDVERKRWDEGCKQRWLALLDVAGWCYALSSVVDVGHWPGPSPRASCFAGRVSARFTANRAPQSVLIPTSEWPYTTYPAPTRRAPTTSPANRVDSWALITPSCDSRRKTNPKNPHNQLQNPHNQPSRPHHPRLPQKFLPPPPPPTEKPPPPPPPDDAPPPLPPEPVHKPFQMTLKRAEVKTNPLFHPLPSRPTAIKPPESVPPPPSSKPPSPPPLPPRVSPPLPRSPPPLLPSPPKSDPRPVVPLPPTPSRTKLTLPSSNNDQPVASSSKTLLPDPPKSPPKPEVPLLPPLPEWPPPRSEFPALRSFRVLFDPVIDGLQSIPSSSRHGKEKDAKESPEYWRRMIEHVRSRCTPEVIAERIKGKGKGKEILYRFEGEVIGDEEEEPPVRDPRRLATAKPPRPPRDVFGIMSYEYDSNTPTTPPTTVLLTGFPPLTPNKTLQSHLTQYGTIDHFSRQMDSVTGATLGVVCVRFRKVEEAKKCVEKEDGVPSGSGLNVNGLGASLVGEERRAVLDPEGLILKAYLKEMEERRKKERKEKEKVTEKPPQTPSTATIQPPSTLPTSAASAQLPPIPPPPVVNGLPTAPKPLHPSLPLNPMLNKSQHVNGSARSGPWSTARLPQRPMNSWRQTNRSPSPQLDEKARAMLQSSSHYGRDRDRDRDRGRDSWRRDRDERERQRDSERQRQREREREERERNREREKEKEREKEREREKVKADVRAALSENGQEHLQIKLQTSTDAVLDDDVAEWVKQFKDEVDKIHRDHEFIYITFKLAKTARRVERVLTGQSIGFQTAVLSVHAAPAPEEEWKETDLLSKAQEMVLKELSKVVLKDIDDRIVGPEVRNVMNQWKADKAAGIATSVVDKDVPATPKVMDLKSLSFKKARIVVVAQPQPEPEPEPEPERPKKKRKKEVVLKKPKKVVVVVESEDEENLVESEDETVDVPLKRPLADEVISEEPLKKRIKLDVDKSKKKKEKDKRRVSVDDVVVPEDIETFEPPVVADLRLSVEREISSIATSPSPIEEPPDAFDAGLCEDDEDLYFAKLVLSGAEPTESAFDELPVPDTNIRRHMTGSARSEGFYKISHAEKVAYVPQYQTRAAESEASKVVVNEPPPQHVESSRSNRANARRRAQGLEEINQVQRAVALSKGEAAASNEVTLTFKFNQLQTRKKHLRFARSPIHDWGLYAMEKISRGEMVIEYVGEIIRAQVAEKREKAYERQGIGSSYLFRIDEDLVVDATKKGNLGRLINHSCDPNCTAKIITINGEKKIVIYAKQDIELGDEITYDYHFPFEQDKIPCLCGSAKCRGFLN
ncbi:hypothetical protein MIND_01192200 [Mycena indigotica]|uniref:Histone-lysine N-methyltransferase, H3 lysine-4 specific n=1 Tax=Mycena indigotica TaxID=2126181 RepID=A0A8H6S6E5_9AGAR|nr:uncharacterized protein MIND_01192200 [Mycena indigotica]KAF7292931.1 hypothetical protein MIND_01192200 [Mycena indigotica]